MGMFSGIAGNLTIIAGEPKARVNKDTRCKTCIEEMFVPNRRFAYKQFYMGETPQTKLKSH